MSAESLRAKCKMPECKNTTTHKSDICQPCRVRICNQCGKKFSRRNEGDSMCYECRAKKNKAFKNTEFFEA